MTFVLDASVPLEWYLGQEKLEEARQIATRLLDETAVVTQMWPLEITNVLSLAVRKGHISGELRSAAFAELGGLSLDVDDLTNEYAWTETTRLADRHDLTAYDASYLELAIRRKLALASFDKKLIRAARAERIEVLP